MVEQPMPTYDQLMQPTINALRALGGEATGQQICTWICNDLQLAQEVTSRPHSETSNHTELEYRLMWTRTYLKRVGLINNPVRGTWTMTDQGERRDVIDPAEIVREVRLQMKSENDSVDDDGSTNMPGSVSEEQRNPSSDDTLELKSQTPLYPTYESARQFLQVLDGVSYTLYRDMVNDIRAQQGSPQEQVDWANPDQWIAERLIGPSQALADRLWRKSGKTLNPRHVRGVWYLATKHDLIERDREGVLHVTELGQDFIDNPSGFLEAEIDAYEGLLAVLAIVAEKGPGRRSDLLPDYEEYSVTYTTARSDNVIKSFLYARLTNLIDRGLILSKSQRYEITDRGLAYLARFGDLAPGAPAATEKQADILRIAKALRDEAREQLRAHLHEMDPFRFEELIRLLLEEMGYDGVNTTSATNDKGVDVIGEIELGISSVREVIQVKRTKGSVHRPILDQLRGSLHRFGAVRGTIITTGRYSRGAEQAAFEAGAAPITLIDGDKLLDLLISHEIGIGKRQAEYYEFSTEKLPPP